MIKTYERPFYDAFKVIMVQLALKGSILGLRKVVREYELNKLGLIVDAKGASVRMPGHNMLLSLLFDFLQHLMKLYGELGFIRSSVPVEHGHI
jgi:hypothetical protein